MLSGYQGGEDVGAVILDAVARVKAVSPSAVYCCDPVMGDLGRGMFVRPGIPEFMRDRVVPAADVITPNHFELDFLAGTTTATLAALLDAADRVRAAGPSVVLVTSTILDDTPEERLDMIAVSGEGAWRTRTPRLAVNPPGAGDLTAAVFLANLLDAHPLPVALARTTSSVFAVVEATADRGRPGDAHRRDPGPARRAAHGVRAGAAALSRRARFPGPPGNLTPRSCRQEFFKPTLSTRRW